MRRGADGDGLLQPAAAVPGARLHDDAADVRAEQNGTNGVHGDGDGLAGLAVNLGGGARPGGFTGLVDLQIERIDYSVPSNTLNVDVPPLSLYLAPAGRDGSERSERGEVRDAAAILGGDDGRGRRDARAERGARLTSFAQNIATPFTFIAATTLRVTRSPTGKIDMTISGKLAASLWIVLPRPLAGEGPGLRASRSRAPFARDRSYAVARALAGVLAASAVAVGRDVRASPAPRRRSRSDRGALGAGPRRRRAAGVHAFLQLLADLEERQPLRTDGDRATRARVAPVVAAIAAQLEAAEAANLDSLATFESRLQRIENDVHEMLSAPLGQLLRFA